MSQMYAGDPHVIVAKSIYWVVAILAVTALQVYSHHDLFHELVEEDVRFMKARHDMRDAVAKAQWPKAYHEWYTARYNSDYAANTASGILIGGPDCIPLGKAERFRDEVCERFREPVTCETLEWFWKRSGALGAYNAKYILQYREVFEEVVLYPMGCPVSAETKEYQDRL